MKMHLKKLHMLTDCGISPTSLMGRYRYGRRILAKTLLEYNNRNEYLVTYEDIKPSERTENIAYNGNLETSTYIQSGELWNIKLSEIVENEEVFQALNEIGMWNLQELIECSEQQLREEYELDDEIISDIKEFLNELGLELSGDTESELKPEIERTAEKQFDEKIQMNDPQEREELERIFYEKIAEVNKYRDMLKSAIRKKEDVIELSEKLRKAVDELEKIIDTQNTKIDKNVL